MGNKLAVWASFPAALNVEREICEKTTVILIIITCFNQQYPHDLQSMNAHISTLTIISHAVQIWGALDDESRAAVPPAASIFGLAALRVCVCVWPKVCGHRV